MINPIITRMNVPKDLYWDHFPITGRPRRYTESIYWHKMREKESIISQNLRNCMRAYTSTRVERAKNHRPKHRKLQVSRQKNTEI